MRTQNKSFYHFKVRDAHSGIGGVEHYFRTAGDITKVWGIPKSSIYKQIGGADGKWHHLKICSCRLPIFQQIEINY